MADIHNNTDISLSVCIPAYNREDTLKRALRSIVATGESVSGEVEIVVSDDSTNPTVGEIAKSELAAWRGPSRYAHNSERLHVARNMNSALRMSRGKFVMVLHDDDYMIQNGVATVVEFIRNNTGPVILFGVNVVDESGRIVKRQAVSKETRYGRKAALATLLNNSSFVRLPGMVFARRLLDDVGYFDPVVGLAPDTDMWVRLVSAYGLVRAPNTTAAYSVHEDALTMGMFNEQTVNNLLKIFDRAERVGLLSADEIHRCKGNFFHQFILAGTYRHIRRRDYGKAKAVMKLFELSELRDLSASLLKWLLIRRVFSTYLSFCP